MSSIILFIVLFVSTIFASIYCNASLGAAQVSVCKENDSSADLYFKPEHIAAKAWIASFLSSASVLPRFAKVPPACVINSDNFLLASVVGVSLNLLNKPKQDASLNKSTAKWIWLSLFAYKPTCKSIPLAVTPTSELSAPDSVLYFINLIPLNSELAEILSISINLAATSDWIALNDWEP